MSQPFIYSCGNCSQSFPKWTGACTNCGAWDTLTKIMAASKKEADKKRRLSEVKLNLVDFSTLSSGAENNRISTSINEFDRVLGGGLVPNSLILLVGEPGIGKSTLVLQIAAGLSKHIAPLLYISGEESPEQLKMRFDRLNLNPAGIQYLGDTNLEAIEVAIAQLRPKLVIIDSIQTLYTSSLDSAAGTIGQIRANINALMNVAKKEKTTVLVIGHVTKSGDFAGPKTLEHLVDCLLILEGDRFSELRILKSPKNRFGQTAEIGVFEMKPTGLMPANDPAKIFIKNTSHVSGSAITTVMSGSRVFFAEIQALVNKSNFHYPLRKALGFDLNRLQLIIAVLKQRASLNLNYSDIHLKIARGVEIDDPAADLAVALAIVSAHKNTVLDNKTLILGELGLSGEITDTPYSEKRLQEAERLGFGTVLGPIGATQTKLQVLEARTLEQAIRQLF